VGFQKLDDLIPDDLGALQSFLIPFDIALKVALSPDPAKIGKFVGIEETLESFYSPCTPLVGTDCDRDCLPPG